MVTTHNATKLLERANLQMAAESLEGRNCEEPLLGSSPASRFKPPHKARPHSGLGRCATAFRALAALLVVSALSGCATPQQWGPELRLKQLCAKEGGLTIYNRSVLPISRALVAGSKTSLSSAEKYYEEFSVEYIQRECADRANCLEVSRLTTKLFSASTSELIAKEVTFLRTGGDWFFPSTSKCHFKHDMRSIFLE